MAFVAFALIGGLVVASALCALVIHRAIKRQQREAALHAPLLDSDAQEQARVCALCAFENPYRNPHCVLCGSPLPSPFEETAGPSQQSAVCCRSLSLWLGRNKTSTPTETMEQDGDTSGTQLTTRQQRARNRKEWTRVISTGSDDQERFVWRRQPPATNDPTLASMTDLSQGYIVNFDVGGDSPLELVHDEQSEDLVASDGSYYKLEDDGLALERIVVVGDEPFDVADVTADALELLTAEVTSTSLQLVAVDDGHRAVVGHAVLGLNCTTPSAAFNTQAFSSVAEQGFPTKYAHFVTVASALLGDDAEQPRVQLKISRENAYDESMVILSQLSAGSVRAPVSVQFKGESGVDAGGLFRDWLTLMCSSLVESKCGGVFVATDTPDVAFHLCGSTSSIDDTDTTNKSIANAFSAGRFIGRALLEGYPLGFHLSLPLLKLMLGVPITFSDLEFLDAESHRGLVWLLENDGVDALALDFTVTESRDDGKVSTVELVPGGADVAVTDANKREFVSLKLRHLVFSRTQTVLYPFLKGVYEVIPADLLMIFDPEELDYVLSGSDEIDVDDWRRNTKYTADLQGHMAMRWFWELVAEMPNEYRRRLVRFATGSSRVPLGGFAALTSYDGRLSPFTLKGVSWIGSGGYIRSHACFNRLDLPLYVDRDDLKQMLFAIVESEDTAGFTMA